MVKDESQEQNTYVSDGIADAQKEHSTQYVEQAGHEDAVEGSEFVFLDAAAAAGQYPYRSANFSTSLLKMGPDISGLMANPSDMDPAITPVAAPRNCGGVNSPAIKSIEGSVKDQPIPMKATK